VSSVASGRAKQATKTDGLFHHAFMKFRGRSAVRGNPPIAATVTVSNGQTAILKLKRCDQ
jgi:hypothetical protein